MTKIKIIGALVFILSILLIVLFNYTNNKNTININLINTINQQKSFTQDISKNIFYLYKDKDMSLSQLNTSVKVFLSNMETRDERYYDISSKAIKLQNSKIVLLWNKFYILVQNFKDQKKITTAYSNIILEKTVKDIYNINLKLVLEFDALLKVYNQHINQELSLYENIQYILFTILVLLLIYLFTQVQAVITFIQKFLFTSKNILTNSSIKELEPIKLDRATTDISQAIDNFNVLVENIDKSIKYSSESIEHSYKSIDMVEQKVEDLMKLINIMEENDKIDTELNKKEDALIQSLEELTTSSQKLKKLKKDLKNLLQHLQ